MYYYYYYDSFVQLNFRIVEENKRKNILLTDVEDLINCINELNRCAVKHALQNELYNETHFLQLKKIKYNSPLELGVVVPLAASIVGIPYLLLKCIEKINNIRIESEKHSYDKRLKRIQIERETIELEKLKTDSIEKSKNRVFISDKILEENLERIVSDKIFESVLNKLRKLPFKIIESNVQIGFIDNDEE